MFWKLMEKVKKYLQIILRIHNSAIENLLITPLKSVKKIHFAKPQNLLGTVIKSKVILQNVLLISPNFTIQQ